MSLTAIIPSAKIANVARCVAAIDAHEHGVRLIVVADGIPLAERGQVPGVEWVEGVAPFCYAANVNRGIAAAGEDDVIVCNDDALLQTAGGFKALQRAATHYGLISATIFGRCCNERQKLACAETHAEPDFLAFVCVCIPRATIRRLGLLDEQFQPGTWEDNDYSRRAREAGLALGICGGCVVIHEGTHTTFERRADYRGALAENRDRFLAKWSRTRVLLSICVCSIYSRRGFLDRLLAALRPQLDDYTELLLAVDAGQISIGAKRQGLLEQARGEFIVYIDDDDLIAPHYVREVLLAIWRAPFADCITYRGKRYHDGAYEADCIYSLANADNSGHVWQDGHKVYLRFPYHVTPIRRELARQIGFSDRDFLEDTIFAERLRSLLKTEEHIPDYLYLYFWRSSRPGEQTHRALTV